MVLHTGRTILRCCRPCGATNSSILSCGIVRQFRGLPGKDLRPKPRVAILSHSPYPSVTVPSPSTMTVPLLLKADMMFSPTSIALP